MLVAAAGAALLDWFAVADGRDRLESVAKPLVMVLLIAAAAAATDDVRWWIVAGLTCGLVGDVLLLPAVDRFVAGLGAFLAGHLLYAIGFVASGVSAIAYVAGAAVAAALVGLVGRPIVAAVAGGRLHAPVAAYVAAIAVMVAAAVGTGRWLFGAGAVVFALSDALLGQDRFVTPRDDRRVAVHVLYHVGQAVIVLGLDGV